MFNIFTSFGELFITNDEVSGSMENLKIFKVINKKFIYIIYREN